MQELKMIVFGLDSLRSLEPEFNDRGKVVSVLN